MLRWLVVGVVGMAIAALVVVKQLRREDYSTPRSAVKSFYVALVTGSTDSAKAAITEPTQGDLVDEIKLLVEAVRSAQKEAVARFGDSGKDVSGDLPTLADVDEASETIEGDCAVLTVERSKRSVKLKKVNGSWKVDVFSLLGIDAKNAEAVKRGLASGAQVARQIAQKIKEGQYASAQAANEALGTQVRMAVAKEVAKDMFKDFKLGL